MAQSDSINLFEFERRSFQAGHQPVAGVDEAGRGPLAGPVVAAAVVLPEAWMDEGLPEPLLGLTDSKKLTERQRERFFEFLTATQGVISAVAQVKADVIDEINILKATHRAMNQALAGLQPRARHALVDGRPVPSLILPQTPLIKGDSRSYSIAAASVLAKVTRDRLMQDFHGQWPDYGFAKHKGYGTRQHLEALNRLGPCPIHRRSFAPIRQPQPELF